MTKLHNLLSRLRMHTTSTRLMADAASPLEDAGILLHVLSILGPGQNLLISAVSKAWRASYQRVAAVEIAALAIGYGNSVALHTIESDTTLYSAVFASAASIRLAHDCGLTFKSKELQCIAGRVADVPTLRAACELGLALTDEVLFGAAESGSVSKLQWFHSDQGCQLPPDICNYAAKSGSIHVLSWLRERGSAFTASACANAAGGAYLHLLLYLRDEGCEWSEYACTLAAKNGHLSTVVWLHEQGCPWNLDEICGDAAESGSIELLTYLKQQGCEFNDYTITAAAQNGRLAVCRFLVAEQCPWIARACAGAAAAGHLETVRFLLESGCPWEPDTICERAAESSSIEVLQYLKQQGGVFTKRAMRMAAYMGNLHVIQYLHSEQCPWDTSACTNACGVDILHWLREQGCPGNPEAVRCAAAEADDLDMVLYMAEVQPAASAAQLTQMLNAAGANDSLETAEWLRQQGAKWPAVLRYSERSWRGAALQWARAEGCTSPVV
jgi:hypothetical protein